MLSTKKRVSGLYRTATTSYPCYGQVLGEFRGSWSYKTYPIVLKSAAKLLQKNGIRKILDEKNKYACIFLIFSVKRLLFAKLCERNFGGIA